MRPVRRGDFIRARWHSKQDRGSLFVHYWWCGLSQTWAAAGAAFCFARENLSLRRRVGASAAALGGGQPAASSCSASTVRQLRAVATTGNRLLLSSFAAAVPC